jgi:hypothetical protein
MELDIRSDKTDVWNNNWCMFDLPQVKINRVSFGRAWYFKMMRLYREVTTIKCADEKENGGQWENVYNVNGIGIIIWSEKQMFDFYPKVDWAHLPIIVGALGW